MNHAMMFAQLSKVDVAKRLVFGRIADASVDKADEAMDYGRSKPYFEKWSGAIAKDSGGQSLGNVRAMHGKVAAGKVVEINFDDKAESIDVVSKIVDDNEWNKVLEGVYTGFSIGGSYIDRSVEKMADGKEIRRYVADPSEVSLVDRPCNPNAKFFDVQKADGAVEKVEFKPASDDLIVAGTEDEVEALAKFMNDNGLDMKAVLAKLAEPAPVVKTDPPAPTEAELRKAANVNPLVTALGNFGQDAAVKAYLATPGGEELRAVLAMAGVVLKSMVDADLEKAQVESNALSMACAAIAKFEGDPLVSLVKIGARNSAGDSKRIQAIHDASKDLGAGCKDGDDAAGKATAPADLQKAIGAAIEPLQKALDETKAALGAATEKITKLEAQPAAAKVSLNSLGKSGDVIVDNATKVEKVEPIKDDRGEVHEVAGLIKSMHRTGGTPLLHPR